MSFWREVFSILIPDKLINQLLAEGAVRIDATHYIKQAKTIVADGCRAYVKQLPLVFAAPADRFKMTEFQICLDSQDIRITSGFDRKMRAANAEVFSITKDKESTEIVVALLYVRYEYYQLASYGKNRRLP